MASKQSYGWPSIVLLAASVLAYASPASACVVPTDAPAFSDGAPLDGADGVPTDVVPFYRIPIAVLSAAAGTSDFDPPPGQFTLATAQGRAIEITVRLVHSLTFEIVPSEPLEPNTEHVLRGAWSIEGDIYTDELTFTTGAGPLATPPEPPDPRLVHYNAAEPEEIAICAPVLPTGTCIWDTHNDQFIELALLMDDGTVAYSMLAHQAMAISLLGSGEEPELQCVRLRTRGLNGRFSTPVTRCRDGEPVQDIATDDVRCTPDGPAWFGPDGELIYLLGPDEDAGTTESLEPDAAVPDDESSAPQRARYGCSCSAPPGARSEPLSIAWLALALTGLRRLTLRRLAAQRRSEASTSK